MYHYCCNQPISRLRFVSLSGAITNESSLFTYDSEHLLNEYYFSPKHDPSFIPQFSVSEEASDPLLDLTLKMCVGDGAQFCKYDTLITRSLELGNNTLHAVRGHTATAQDLQPGETKPRNTLLVSVFTFNIFSSITLMRKHVKSHSRN